jgi:hypothetical protein
VAVALVKDGPTLMDDLFALLHGLVCAPILCDQSQSKVLAEPCADIIFADVSTVEIDAGEEGLSVLKSCHHEVVIKGILFVPPLIPQSCQIVSVLLHRVVDSIIIEIRLASEFFQLAGCLLEICELSSGSDD